MALILRDVSCMNVAPIVVKISMSGRSDQDMFSSDPTCHRNAVYMSSELAVRMIRVVRDPKNIETAVPARRMVAGLSPILSDTMVMMATGMSAKTNAFITTAYSLSTRVAPSISASTAPRQAPEDTPVVYASARGFFRTPCMDSPARANAAPAMPPAMERGSRTFHTM